MASHKAGFALGLIGALALNASAFAYTDAEQDIMTKAAHLKKSGASLVNDCGNTVKPEFSTIKLGGSVGDAPVMTVEDATCYGAAGAVTVIFKAENGKFKPILSNTFISPEVLTSQHKGVADIRLGVPGMELPVYIWNGKEYVFWKSVPDPAAAR